jgi:DNA-binding MarR family transcriptional regulator
MQEPNENEVMMRAMRLDGRRDAAAPEIQSTIHVAGASLNLDVLPDLLGYNVRRAQIELWRDFGSSVAEGEVRPGLFSLLLLVGANPGIAQIDLANQLSVDKASIVALVDRLEEAGWVQRKRSTEDRRRQEIYATAAGQKKLAQLKREVLEHDAKYCALYTAEELRSLLQLLQRIYR